MTNPISLVVTYNRSARENIRWTVDATALLLSPTGCASMNKQYRSDESLAIEDVMDRLTVQLSAPSHPLLFEVGIPVSISTKFH